MSDHIEHTPHYTHCRAEVIDLLEDLGVAAAYCQGNAIKYLFRCDRKGQREDDLRKAAWYAQRLVEIEDRQAERDLDALRARHDRGDDHEWEEANEELLCHVGELQHRISVLRDVVRGFIGQCDGLQPFRYLGNDVYDRIASLVRRAREALIDIEAGQ